MTQMKLKFYSLGIIWCSMVFFAMGCGAPDSGLSSNADLAGPFIRTSVVVPKFILDPIESAKITITAPDIATPIEHSFTNVQEDSGNPNQVTFHLDVPVGSNRLFTVEILTFASGEGFRGFTTMDITAAGTTVPVDVVFLNQIRDFNGDEEDVAGITQDPDLVEVHLMPVLAGQEQRIEIELAFSAPVNSFQVGALIFLDTDFSAQTGSTSLMSTFLGNVTVTTPLGVERIIEVRPDSVNPLVTVYNGDLSTFLGTTQSLIHAYWNQTSSVLTIDVQRTFFEQLASSDGHFNVLVGASSGPQQHEATDAAYDREVADYDTNVLIIP